MMHEKALKPSSVRMPALDGLRGIAILVVMLFHFRWIFEHGADRFSRFVFGALSFGWIGVDLFFVLSGFLITGILLDSRGSPYYFRTFYGRRFLRIFPLYYLILGIVLGAGPAVSRLLHSDNLWYQINPVWYILYVANWQPVYHGAFDPMLGHFWSLCIEEQFYIVCSALLWLLPDRWLPPLPILLAVSALLIRIGLLHSGNPDQAVQAVYRLTLARMDGLALGAWVAIAIRSFHLAGWLRIRARILFWLGLAGTTAVVIAQHGFNPARPPMQSVGFSFLAILFAAIVYAGANASGPLKAALTWKPLTIAGTFSYAMYIFHVPLDFFLQRRTDHIAATLPLAGNLALRSLYIVSMTALMFGVGWLSWNLFEKRLLSFKRYLQYRSELNESCGELELKSKATTVGAVSGEEPAVEEI